SLLFCPVIIHSSVHMQSCSRCGCSLWELLSPSLPLPLPLSLFFKFYTRPLFPSSLFVMFSPPPCFLSIKIIPNWLTMASPRFFHSAPWRILSNCQLTPDQKQRG